MYDSESYSFIISQRKSTSDSILYLDLYLADIKLWQIMFVEFQENSIPAKRQSYHLFQLTDPANISTHVCDAGADIESNARLQMFLYLSILDNQYFISYSILFQNTHNQITFPGLLVHHSNSSNILALCCKFIRIE